MKPSNITEILAIAKNFFATSEIPAISVTIESEFGIVEVFENGQIKMSAGEFARIVKEHQNK